MPRGVAKSRFNFKTNSCEHEDASWCTLPKYKRCKHCLRLRDGSKACEVMI